MLHEHLKHLQFNYFWLKIFIQDPGIWGRGNGTLEVKKQQKQKKPKTQNQGLVFQEVSNVSTPSFLTYSPPNKPTASLHSAHTGARSELLLRPPRLTPCISLSDSTSTVSKRSLWAPGGPGVSSCRVCCRKLSSSYYEDGTCPFSLLPFTCCGGTWTELQVPDSDHQLPQQNGILPGRALPVNPEPVSLRNRLSSSKTYYLY